MLGSKLLKPERIPEINVYINYKGTSFPKAGHVKVNKEITVSMAYRRTKLYKVQEHKDEEFLSKRWEDFDHSQKFSLGVWGSTWTVRDKTTSEKYVLQSCHSSTWTKARFELLQIGREKQDFFVAPNFMFFRQDWVYVCSEVGGICLAEMIDSTASITEAQAATIVFQV